MVSSASFGGGLAVREPDDDAGWIRSQPFVVVQALDQRFVRNRNAERRKEPEPQAGSQTLRARISSGLRGMSPS